MSVRPMTNARVSADWSALDRGTANDAATYFMEFLWTILCMHIPYETVVIKKRNHPSRCENAIAAKNSAEGHLSFEDQREKCAGVLAEEHQKYVATLREKISKLKKCSKQYWRLNRELLCNKRQVLFNTTSEGRNALGKQFKRQSRCFC